MKMRTGAHRPCLEPRVDDGFARVARDGEAVDFAEVAAEDAPGVLRADRAHAHQRLEFDGPLVQLPDRGGARRRGREREHGLQHFLLICAARESEIRALQIRALQNRELPTLGNSRRF